MLVLTTRDLRQDVIQRVNIASCHVLSWVWNHDLQIVSITGQGVQTIRAYQRHVASITVRSASACCYGCRYLPVSLRLAELVASLAGFMTIPDSLARAAPFWMLLLLEAP